MRNRPRPASLRLASPLVLTLGLGLLVAFPLGCEPRDTGVSAELEEAIELVQLASRGYVPAAYADEFEAVEIEAFRQATLAEARPHLEAAIRTGTSAEQVTARQMLADIHASAARALGRDAQAAAARLAVDTGNLAPQLRHVSKLHNRITQLTLDRTVVQRELTEETEQQQARREALLAEQEQLQAELETLTEQRDGHRQRASEAEGQAHALREQAFTLEGDEHYDTLDEAADTQRRAAEADVDADRIDALIERRRSELAAIDTELEEIDTVLAGLADQLEKWQQREQSRADQVAALEAEHAEAAEVLVARFEAAVGRYRQEVDAPFTEARRHLAEAVELMEAAVGQAGRDRRVPLQRAELVHRIAHVQLLTDHVMAAGAFGRTLAPLALRGPAVLPETLDARPIEQAYRDLADQQEQALVAGISAARAGQSLASELGNVADEAIQRFADRQRTNLARYIERLNDHALN